MIKTNTVIGISIITIAINKDKNAPIFQICDFGIVGDLFEVIPTMIESINEKHFLEI